MLGIDTITASTGWLAPIVKRNNTVFGWLAPIVKRNNTVFGTVSGEREDVNIVTVADWKVKLPTICKDYDTKHIFNMEEPGIFLGTPPERHFTSKLTIVRGVNAPNLERITVRLCVSITGVKLKLIVIGKFK